MDLISLLVYIAYAMVLPICFLIGRILDPDWRCMQMRKWLRRNYVVLNILEGDSRNYRTLVVNADKDMVYVSNACWVITKGRIYRKDKSEKGFKIKKTNISFGNQGAPNIFVSHDDIKPVEFSHQCSNVKPDEIGSALQAWVSNEKAKNYTNANKLMTLVIIACLLSAGSLILSFLNHGTLSEMTEGTTAQVTGNARNVPVPEGGTIEGNSIVIRQEGVEEWTTKL